MKEQEVILVNEQDEPAGVMDKMEAHRKGLLHRAFSIFIFDAKGRLLLQQRAAGKYHGGLLWTNTCCSHPYPGEATEAAAARRLQEELGFTTRLAGIFSFTYRAVVEHGLVEHEFDHVFTGEYEGSIVANRTEVNDYTYEEMDRIAWAISHRPDQFTSWFRIVFPRVEAWWRESYG